MESKIFSVQLKKLENVANFGLEIQKIGGVFEVKKIFDGSSAAESGRISTGDILLAVNGDQLLPKDSDRRFEEKVEELPPDQIYELKFLRRNFDEGIGAEFLFPAIEKDEKEAYFRDLREALLAGDSDKVLEVGINRHFEHSKELLNEADFDPLHMACDLGLLDVVTLFVPCIDVNKKSEIYGV